MYASANCSIFLSSSEAVDDDDGDAGAAAVESSDGAPWSRSCDASGDCAGSLRSGDGGGDSVGGSCASARGAVKHAALVISASNDDFKNMIRSSLKRLARAQSTEETQVPDAQK